MKNIPGLKISKLVRPRLAEWFVTCPLTARAECHRYLRTAGATSVAEEVFAGAPVPLGNPAWPVTWLCVNPKLTGVQIHAVQGVPVDRIEKDGWVVGSVFAEGSARHSRLGGLRPVAAGAGPAEEARATFELRAVALREAGMTFAN